MKEGCWFGPEIIYRAYADKDVQMIRALWDAWPSEPKKQVMSVEKESPICRKLPGIR